MPFVAKWPHKIKAGTQSDHIAAYWDILPTFCDIANVTVQSKTDGISFLPTLLFEDLKQENHKYLYWEFNGYCRICSY